MELIKDFDISILYHLGKANMVVDELNQKPVRMVSLAFLEVSRHPLARVVWSLDNNFQRLQETSESKVMDKVNFRSTFYVKIKR